LLAKRAMAISDRNIYFLTDTGIMQYGSDGIRNLSQFKVTDASAYTDFFYSKKDRILKCRKNDGQLWYQVDYDNFFFVDTECIFVGELHNKNNVYIVSGESDVNYIDDTANKLNGKIITGKISARNKLRTLYSTKDMQIKINMFSAKVGISESYPYYIFYYDNERHIYFGTRLQGTLLNIKEIPLKQYLRYHPANVKADFINLEISVDKTVGSFDMLVLENGGR